VVFLCLRNAGLGMRTRKVVLLIAFVLMQALLLTQVDFSLAVMPANGNSADISHHQKYDACLPVFQYQAINQTAYVYVVLALAPHMPFSGLSALSAVRHMTVKENNQFFAALIKHISETLFRWNGRVLVDSIARTKYLWAHVIEAIGPPCAMRPMTARDVTPNC